MRIQYDKDRFEIDYIIALVYNKIKTVIIMLHSHLDR